MKPTGNQKEDGVGPFRSQHAAPDWPNLLSRQIRIGNVSACSLCHETVVKKRQSEWFLLVPPPPTVQSMLSIHSSAFDNSGTPTSVNNMSRIFMFLFLSTRGICRDSFLLWEFNFCFQWFFLFVVSTFRHLHGALQLVRCNHQLAVSSCGLHTTPFETFPCLFFGIGISMGIPLSRPWNVDLRLALAPMVPLSLTISTYALVFLVVRAWRQEFGTFGSEWCVA